MKMNQSRISLAGTIVTIALSALISTITFAQKSGNPLRRTSWQLLKFTAPDESTYAPDDKSKYTITFNSNGRVVARVDCNRDSSTWKARANGEMNFGSWSRRSACIYRQQAVTTKWNRCQEKDKTGTGDVTRTRLQPASFKSCATQTVSY